jgi:hypothetical protein
MTIIRLFLRALTLNKPVNVKIMKNVALNITPLNPQLFNSREKLKGPIGERINLVKRSRGSCPYINAPMILSNGSFVACCMDGLEEVAVGRVTKENSILQIINGGEYQNLINGF